MRLKGCVRGFGFSSFTLTFSERVLATKEPKNETPADRIRDLERKIRELNEIKEVLRENEEKFRNLFNRSNDAIFFHDLHGKIIDANQKALTLFQYTNEEIKSLQISSLHPEDATEKSNQALDTIMRDGFLRFEIDFRKKNGGVFPAEVSSSIFTSGGGKFIQKIVRDISRRKQAERALRNSEAKLRAIFNASPLAIVLVARDGKVLDTNTEHAERLKMTRSQMIGKCIWDLLPSSVLGHRKRQVETVFDTGMPLSGEDEREGVWNEYHIHPAIRNANGDVEAVIVEALDITDRKHARNALIESENRYRTLFDSSHSVMLIIDPENGDILDANPAAISFYGWPREEITMMKISGINVLTNSQVICEMQMAKQELRRVFHFKHRLANGNTRDVEVYSGPISIQGRQVLFSIVHDITQRNRAEEERNKLISELQTALKEIKTLRGILPICSGCKKIRDDQGYWNLIEDYIHEHSEAELSHGLCPDCTQKLYPELYARLVRKKAPEPEG